MISGISATDKVIPLYIRNRSVISPRNQVTGSENSSISTLQGIPRSYISFKASEKPLNYKEDAKQLLEHAGEIAQKYKHAEIMPQHILEAAIEETIAALEAFDDEIFDTGMIESVSPLNKIANDYAKTNLISKASGRAHFKAILTYLQEDNLEALNEIPASNNVGSEGLKLSPDLQDMLKDIGEKNHNNIDSHILLGSAINNMIYSKILYPSEFLKQALSYAAYKNIEDISKNYMKVYNSRAIDVWNKLALGSNLTITYKNTKEADRLTSSIIKTINQPKYGSFNNKNTVIYVFSDNISSDTALSEVSELASIEPDKQKVVMLKLDNLLVNSSQSGEDSMVPFNTLAQIVAATNDKLQLVLFQSNDLFYKIKNDPIFESIFNNMVTYSIPQIQAYEAKGMLNKKMLQEVKTPFTRDAKDRAIYHAANINGIFPDKAIDLMKRISKYYGNSKSKITTQDVDEFAQAGYELFNKNNNDNIIYDTGKTLNNFYGKETTRKDVEALVRQIRTGKIGTRGIIIYSKDNESGSGRKYTAETIAGEAKIPFVSIDTSDFATYERNDDGVITDSPKGMMKRIFSEAKNAARQNPNKTAIIFINNFEEFALSGPYITGYKQAMSQLSNEMEEVKDEDVSILVMGSADEYYAYDIPKYIRGFNQFVAVDTPAYNKKSRKETLVNQINEVGLPIMYKKNETKEMFLKNLVKLTEYMSFVEIKSLIDKTKQIMYERNKQKASMGDFIEAYLQLITGRTSRPEMPEFNKQATTSHECGHATNLEVMNDILQRKGKPWHQGRDVNFITLDPRGNFLGAVFEGKSDNNDYPFEAMFTALVCSYGGYSCEKLFFGMDGSYGIVQDLAQASEAAKRGVEYCGFGFNTGKISNAANIKSAKFYESVFKDMDVILTNAQIVSDMITEAFRGFNEWFTDKYSKLIGTDDCMVDGEEFRKALKSWKNALSADKKEELNIMEDMIMDVIKASKNGQKYFQLKKLI